MVRNTLLHYYLCFRIHTRDLVLMEFYYLMGWPYFYSTNWPNKAPFLIQNSGGGHMLPVTLLHCLQWPGVPRSWTLQAWQFWRLRQLLYCMPLSSRLPYLFSFGLRQAFFAYKPQYLHCFAVQKSEKHLVYLFSVNKHDTFASWWGMWKMVAHIQNSQKKEATHMLQ